MEPGPNDLKAIRILYIALLISQIVFATIVIVLVETGIVSIHNDSLNLSLQIAVLVLIAAAIPASIFLFRKRLSEISPQDEFTVKFKKYREALILKMALCQGPVMFTIIAYFISDDHFFLWIIILLIINFMFIYPSQNKIVQQLQLSSGEQSSLGML